MPSRPRARRCPRDLPELRHREPRGAEVLLRVRHDAGKRVPVVRRRERAGREVLRRVRRRRSERPRGASRSAASTPAAERRLVSVLFADLVGFTTLSESRDSEDVRELLSRYFDTSRRLIELYGGTVEKFIGDAVMAVWGTPTATEDDAERAVRAALDLVTSVSALGEEFGAPDLRLRAGVLTGEAAVTLGAEGQGMVAGDMVNTAARIQATAQPGTVLVGDATRRCERADDRLRGRGHP